MIAAISSLSIRTAMYIAGSLLLGMIAREYARAFVATRLNDPTPRLWGRLTWNPRSWFDPFGVGARSRVDPRTVGGRERPVSAARRIREACTGRPGLSPSSDA